MILATALIFATIAEVYTGDSKVVNEGRVVRARTKRLHAKVRTVAKLGAHLGGGPRDRDQAFTFPHRHLRLRIFDVLHHAVDKVFEFARTLCAEVPATVAIRVEISNSMRGQLWRMRLNPLGRAEQRRLFAIPEAVDYRALRMPALLEQFAQSACLFELCARARKGIACTVDPRIMVVAANNPLIRQRGTGNRRDHVVERLPVPVEADRQMCHRHAGADFISERQAAAPALRHKLAVQRLQKRSRIRIRDRQHRNLRNRLHLVERNQLRPRHSADARSLRIARIDWHIHHAATLRALCGPHRTFGVSVAAKVAVVARIGVDDATHRAVLCRDLGLDAAPGLAVPSNHDRAFHRDCPSPSTLRSRPARRSSHRPAEPSHRHRASRRCRSAAVLSSGPKSDRP